MGELKPLGSEKLKGDEKIKRILDLTYYQTDEVLKESTKPTKEGKSGVYGIVRENDGYYVKKGLNENSLDYIGGLFMKNKNRFASYAEAFKKMNFLIEQEEAQERNLQEATKYVLKQKKAPAPEAATETPLPEPAPAPVTAPAAPDAPADEVPPAPDAEMGDEPVEDPNDFMKVLKKYAGKLQQKFNEYSDQLESEDYTEIINQVLSGIEIDELEPSDKEKIIAIFEPEEEVAEPADEVPPVDDTVVPQETAETDDLDGIASLEELIDTPFGDFDDEDDDELTKFDDSFLDDPEVAKAGKAAQKDMGMGPDNTSLGDEYEVTDFGYENDKPKDEYPLYKEKDVDEQIPFSGPAEEETPIVAKEDELEDPIDSNVNDVPGERSDEPPVKELDLDELTDVVNNSVKETLGKYFE